MNFPYYIVNAFGSFSYSGNPVGVCVLTEWLSTDELQKIASQACLSEMNFLFPGESDIWSIRWFSPLMENDMSSSGALASAHVLYEFGYHPQTQKIKFSSAGGILNAELKSTKEIRVEMDQASARSCIASSLLIEGLGAYPDETYIGNDCLCVFSDESIVESLEPEFKILDRIGCARGIIVTANSSEEGVDYVTRFFSPRYGVNEEKISGTIHNLLVPYWSKKFGKEKFRVRQLSENPTTLLTGMNKNLVWIEGKSTIFVTGEMTI